MSETTSKKAKRRNAKNVEVIPANSLPIPAKNPPHLIALVLEKFLCATDDYRDALRLAMPAIAEKRADELRKAAAKIEHFVDTDEDGTEVLKAKGAHAARDMLEAIREVEFLTKSRLLPLMARSVFIGLFSELDSFMGSLLKSIYALKPQLYKGISREIALSDLLNFHDLDDVKRDMLEKEIDSFRRDSYIEQFSALEKKFEIKTLRSFPEWPEFVEMTQRRNVMTHNDGRVSQQYLSICAREGVELTQDIKVGDELPLPPEYLMRSIFVASKVGFMLTHTLWRKVLPEDIDKANDSINDTLFNFLTRKRWNTVAEFGQFSLSEPMSKGLQDMAKRIRVINTAIGLKRIKKKEQALALVDSIDWSASIREFKLATAILNENFSEAANIMRDIGKKGEILEQLSYHDWPLFDDFRDRQEFQDAYLAIYGKPFINKVSKDAQAVTKNISEASSIKKIRKTKSLSQKIVPPVKKPKIKK